MFEGSKDPESVRLCGDQLGGIHVQVYVGVDSRYLVYGAR